MNTLVSLANDLPQLAADVQASGIVRAESVFDWTNNMSTQFQDTMKGLSIALGVALAFIIPIWRKGTIASIILGLVAGAAVIWVVHSGVFWARDRIGDTTEASSVVEHVEQDPRSDLIASGGVDLGRWDLR